MPSKPRDELPPSAEKGQMRAYLARLGVDPQTANDIVRNNETREQITARMIDWQRGL